MKKILFFDIYPLLTKGAALAISEKIEGLDLFEANNLEEATRIIESRKIDLVIVGVGGTSEFSSINLVTSKKIPTVIFYDNPKEAFYLKNVSPYVVGLASRFLDVEAFVLFVKQVMENGKGMCPVTQKYFFDNLHNILNLGTKRYDRPFVKGEGVDSLTRREREIFFMLKDGKTVTSISRELGVKMSTVSTLKKKVYAKLRVENTIQFLKNY